MDDLVRFDRVTCRYGRDPVLVNVDLEIGAGEFVGIVGPSGSGKSTLLKAIAGSVEPIAGRIERDRGLSIGYVPQVETVNWFFPVTVREAVLMARIDGRRMPWPSRQEVVEAQAVLDRLGLAGLADRHIRELSGGQQQRMFLARAMLRDADLILLDEPTSGVDLATRHDILHLLAELNADGLTVLLTTHDLNWVASHLPRIVCLNETVIADGRPAEVLNPEALMLTYGAPMRVVADGATVVVVDEEPLLYADRPDEPATRPDVVGGPGNDPR
jgi:zinc/manganese transport system ATP-binding protein